MDNSTLGPERKERRRLEILRGPFERHCGKITGLSAAAIVASVLLILRAMPMELALSALDGRIMSLDGWGPVAYGMIYIALAVLFVPASPLTVAAGGLFGMWVGTVLVSIASTTAAAISFLIGRYVAGDMVQARVRLSGTIAAIEGAIAESGWKIVALLRLSPVFPFGVSNYLLGTTSIRFTPYVVASWMAMIPGTLMYVYLGDITRVAVISSEAMTAGQWVLHVVGLAATIGLMAMFGVKAKQKLADNAVDADRSADSVAAYVSQRERSKGCVPRAAVASASVALLCTGTAVYAQMYPNVMSGLVTSLFGPPGVALQEAYETHADGPTFDHGLFDELLTAHVDEDGWVDYQAMSVQAPKLDQYLRQLEQAPFDQMGRDEKLVLLINAYNAFTLRLILDYYPVASIKDIPGAKRWDHQRWRIGAHTWSLNQIEHEQIRPRFKEPRIHFALVCAAAGCPPLRPEVFTVDRLEEQLEQQTAFVHSRGTWARFEPDTSSLHLTALYNWYGGDFEQVAGSVLEYAAGYLPDVRQALDSDTKLKIRWLNYDWSLNSVENKMPR